MLAELKGTYFFKVKVLRPIIAQYIFPVHSYDSNLVTYLVQIDLY